MELLQLNDWALLILSLITLGCFSGFFAGLLGVGGGLILVPGLLYAFSFLGLYSENLMHICVGTSLAIIVPTGFSSARAHHKRGNVDTELMRYIGTGIIIGSALGVFTASHLNSETMKYIFAGAILILAGMMIFNMRGKSLFPAMPSPPITTAISTIIGAISSLIGVGGATMNVPLMTFCNTPIHKAIGTASALGLFISIPATIGFIVIGWGVPERPPLSFGYINIPAWLIIIPSSILAARLGAYAAHKAPVKTMRKIFALFMILVSIKIWSDLL